MHRVLHVDPDRKFRTELCRIIEVRNLSAVGFDTFDEAKEALKTGDYTCAVVDVAAADVAWPIGVSDLRNISRGIPIILTTNKNSMEIEKRARLEDVTFYYVKSFSRVELVDAITEAIRLRRKGKRMATAQKKILIIDDDPDFQDALKAILDNAGYSVCQAYNKEEGKQKLAAASPDLIILDIMMETASAGFHFLYETLGPGGKDKPHVPVIAVTSISQKTGFRFSPKSDEDLFPADDYLEKPVKPDLLLNRISSLLEGRAQGGSVQ